MPGTRPPYDRSPASATPIYDSLCHEYRRLFRALPGDRTGEEELRFRGFTGYGAGGLGEFGEFGRHRHDVSAPPAAAYAPAALPPGSDRQRAERQAPQQVPRQDQQHAPRERRDPRAQPGADGRQTAVQSR
nr:hypothetical protein [Streptomyces specialis]